MIGRSRLGFSGLPRMVTGAAWMVLAGILIGTLSTLVRGIGSNLHPFEIAFFRNVVQIALLLPWVLTSGFAVLRTRRIWAHIRRSGFGILAMLTWFSALTMMPLAEATAISFSAPLFTTAGAHLFLGERVGARRWLATAIGLLGVMMIIRPGVKDVGAPELLALLAAVLIACAMLANKTLARSESPNAMAMWMGIFMTLFSLPPAVFVWSWPTGNIWWWLLALGTVATAAQLSINRAFACADVSFVVPFAFVQIPYVALVGYVVFAETPDAWTWAGAVVIFTSGLYTAHRETRLSRAKTPSSPSATVPSLSEATLVGSLDSAPAPEESSRDKAKSHSSC